MNLNIPSGQVIQNIFASTRGVIYYTHVVRRAHTHAQRARASATEMRAVSANMLQQGHHSWVPRTSFGAVLER